MHLLRHFRHARTTVPLGRATGAALKALRPIRAHRALLSGLALAIVAAPAALAYGTLANAGGRPVRGGIKNPPHGGYYRTTQIWADNASWGTRQSNLGTGGSAIYGCRSPRGGSPCLDADNLRGGSAFSFITNGNFGGRIRVGKASGVPFTTNGHGVATGLNANYLQGKQAKDFQLASQPAADAAKLGGQPPAYYATTGQLLFADVVAGPALQSTRGATAVSQAGTAYTVTFGSTNLTKCSATVSPQGAALTSGQLAVTVGSPSASVVVVNAPSGFSGGFDLQVVC
jgi:hypothetical protein